MCFNTIFTKTIIFALLIVFSSCKKDEIVIEKPVEIINLMNVNIDGYDYKVINEFVSGNENCDGLYIRTSFYEKNNIDFELNISLSKDGYLEGANYGEYKLPIVGGAVRNFFLTPNFYPVKTFTISEFKYDTISRNLSFKFNGKVFWEDNNNVQRNISGKIDIKNFKKTECGIINTGIKYLSQDFILHDIGSNRTKFANNTQLHRYFANNGHIIDVHVQDDFWNLPIGEIVFNQNSVQNRVSIIKQLGGIVANQIANMNQHQWLSYNTQGKIKIEKKEIIDGAKKISGKIDLKMIENGDTVRVLNGIEFSTLSFEN